MAASVLLLLAISVSTQVGHSSAEEGANPLQEWFRAKRTGDSQCCTLDALDSLQVTLQSELQFISQSVLEVGFNLQQFINLGLDPKYPAPSCSALHYSKPYMPSGDYWLGKASNPGRMHCRMHMDNPNMGGKQGWIQLINLDLTDKSQSCPKGFKLIYQQGKRLCAKTVKEGCQSIILPTYGIEYSRVCGRASAFQIGTNNAFYRFNCEHCTINDPYIDGISITHGTHPRKHIWSLAAAWTEYRDSHYRALCPCAKGRGTAPPSFVGRNYYCETGQYWQRKKMFDDDDPLWDGKGCSSKEEDCCDLPDLPWFCADVSKGTADDVEVRVCADQDKYNEDLYLEKLEVYAY